MIFLTLLFQLTYTCPVMAASSLYTSVGGQKFRYEVLIQQADVIWGFDFLDEERIIFSERQGRLLVLDLKSKKINSLKGVPRVWSRGQGGLLDVRVHPKKKNEVYFTYALLQGDGATTALAKAFVVGSELKEVKNIFIAHKANENEIHFGSRIEFDREGHIFISVGDRNKREQVQDLNYHMGKVIRIKEDGSIPSDNPFVKVKDAKPEIWALGLRNPQGLAVHPQTGELWEAEMGPRGGDEINILKKGLNYGWPVITFGREYWGPKIGEGTTKKGMEEPVTYWVPSISPSALTFYTGKLFPKWTNNIFLANLSGQHLRRLALVNNKVIEQEELLKKERTRFRNVRTGPEGALYVSTDDGKIARLLPAK